MTWEDIARGPLAQPGLSPEDRDLCLARLRGIYGEEPARIEQAAKFLNDHCGAAPIYGRPVDLLREGTAGVRRVLRYLERCAS